MGKTTVQSKWLEDEHFKALLAPVASSRYKACCKVCGTVPFNVSNMGQAVLCAHMKGEKHRAKMAASCSSGMSFLLPTCTVAVCSVVVSVICKLFDSGSICKRHL